MPLEDMGLNYFEPAYVFQKGESEKKNWFLLAGLSDEKAFTQQLAAHFQGLTITEHTGFRSAAIPPVFFVWNNDFLIGQWYNPMAGQPPGADALATFFTHEHKTAEADSATANADISIRWQLAKPAPAAALPPFELGLNGSINLEDNTLVARCEIEEHNYLGLLKPFEMHPKHPGSTHKTRLEVWPALESILLQVAAYGGNAYQQEMTPGIIDLVQKMDHPFEINLADDGPHNLLQNIQIKTRFHKEEPAKALENEVLKMLPQSLLKEYGIARNGTEIVFFHRSQAPRFAFEQSGGERIQNGILGIYQSNDKTKSTLHLTALGGAKYGLHISLQNPERLLSHPLFLPAQTINAEAVIHQFLP